MKRTKGNSLKIIKNEKRKLFVHPTEKGLKRRHEI
jgi:hypothetical protein